MRKRLQYYCSYGTLHQTREWRIFVDDRKKWIETISMYHFTYTSAVLTDNPRWIPSIPCRYRFPNPCLPFPEFPLPISWCLSFRLPYLLAVHKSHTGDLFSKPYALLPIDLVQFHSTWLLQLACEYLKNTVKNAGGHDIKPWNVENNYFACLKILKKGLRENQYKKPVLIILI